MVVHIPTRLDREQRELYQRLRDLRDQSSRSEVGNTWDRLKRMVGSSH